MYRLIVILVLMSGLLTAFGEKPATKSAIIRAESSALFDENANTFLPIKNYLVDLKTPRLISEIQIYQPEKLNTLEGSIDNINWFSLTNTSNSVYQNNFYKITFPNGQALQYVKIQNSELVNCQEIKIFPFTNYEFKFLEITATPQTTSCNIIVRTNTASNIQILYDFNWDFLYNKKLSKTLTDLSPDTKHQITLTNLKPDFTYTYQIKLTDLNNNTISSQYFTFTTKPLYNDN